MHHIVGRSPGHPPRMMWANVNPPTTSSRTRDGKAETRSGTQEKWAEGAATPWPVLHALLFLAWPQVTVMQLMILLPIIIAEWVTAHAPRNYLHHRTPRRRNP